MDKPSTPLGLKCAWKEYPSIDNANRRLLSKVSPQVTSHPAFDLFIYTEYLYKYLYQFISYTKVFI
jgi:hypothetical protein